jgi:hypothetical protein
MHREANYTGILLTSEMTAAAGTIGTSLMSTAAGPPELDNRNITDVNSRMEIRNGRGASKGP